MPAFKSIAFLLVAALAGCSENGLLSVTDTSLPGDTDLVIDEPVIEAPVADAGPDQDVGRNTTVTCDGSASYDPGGLAPLVYQWTVVHKPETSASDLSDPTAVNPSFVADEEGTWVLDLTVQNTAGIWDETPARVIYHVTASPPPPAPVANAGADHSVVTGTLVSLDGSASFDPSGLTPLVYQWSLGTIPSGSAATLSSTSAVGTDIVPDVSGDYVVNLTVQNSAGVWDPTPDHTVIHVNNAPVVPPVSDAGPDLTGDRGTTIGLTGLASYDPSGYTPLTYAWTVVSVPASSTAALSSSTSSTPTFVADKVGAYTFDLRVTNSHAVADPSPDRVRVTVTAPPPSEPVADAGADQSTQPLLVVTLNGTASYDPAGLTPLTYQWTFTSRPSGSTTALSSTSASQPTFFADIAGRYEFDLTVKNTQGVWDSTPDHVVVDAVPADGFYVQITWDTDTDLDLHLLNGTDHALLFGTSDADYCNMTPAWNNSGTSDDPSLDWDVIEGYGPETTTITSPSAGTYDINVHFYGMYGSSTCTGTCPSTHATARVYLGGILAATYTKTLTQDGQVWDVARLAWPSRTLTPINTIWDTSLTTCH